MTNGEPAVKERESDFDRGAAKALGLAFCLLGLCLGSMIAMSATSLVMAGTGALFALFGGSILSILSIKGINSQRALAMALTGISLGTLIGIYSGIYVSENKLLSPAQIRNQARISHGVGKGEADVAKEVSCKYLAAATEEASRRYLRENVTPAADAIDVRRRNRTLTLEKAYEELYATCTKQ